MRTRLTALASAVLAAAGVLVAPVAAQADDAVPVGVDVSFPQCGTAAPSATAVAVVGVNDGLATGTNPCLAEQLAWAASASTAPQVYVNTGNPGHAAAWWPSADVARDGSAVPDPVGTCTGGEDPACAYVYGWSLALDDLGRVPVTAAATWWLDVETINSWSADRSANLASVTGMADALRASGAAVGLYSTRRQWTAIVGAVPDRSTLAGLPSWMAGAITQQGAADHCDQDGLTPGSPVALAQFVAGGLDADVVCRSLGATTPAVSGVLQVGSVLTARPGPWTPDAVHLGYQWRRGGVPIAGETAATHVVVPADLRAAVTVTVRGDASGYRPATRTSAPASAPAASTPAPVRADRPAVSVPLLRAR